MLQMQFRTLLVFTASLGLSLPVGAQVSPEETYEIKPYTASGTVRVGGTLLPQKSVTLTAQSPGRVAFIAGREGEYFKEGVVLVKVNDEALQAQLGAAHAQRQAAWVALNEAHNQYRREMVSPGVANHPGGMGAPAMMDRMFSQPMESMTGTRNQGYERFADIRTRTAQIDQAQTTLLQADAGIKQIEEKLRDTQSITPFEGVITRKLIEVGDPVQPGQAMLEFADMATLQLQADIPARLISGLKEGGSVQARIDDGNGTQLPVSIAQIFPKADEVRHTIRVKFDLTQKVGMAGMYAEVMLADPDQKAQALLVVPKSALIWRSGLPRVFVVQNGTNELRLVRVGDPVTDDLVGVLSGLSEGERVVKAPKPGLSTGE